MPNLIQVEIKYISESSLYKTSSNKTDSETSVLFYAKL